MLEKDLKLNENFLRYLKNLGAFLIGFNGFHKKLTPYIPANPPLSQKNL